MNKYYLTAKSLVSYSWLIRVVFIGVALVCAGFVTYGISLPTILVFACCLMGTGYTSRRYLESERRRLVPGINEVCAQVAIFALGLFWIASSVLLIYFHGFKPDWIGGCLTSARAKHLNYGFERV